MAINFKYSSVSRGKSVIICILVYLAAGIVALVVGYSLRDTHPLLIIAIADLAAMMVVFSFSVIFDNSSLYDPYWSVVPVFITLYWALASTADVNIVRQIVVITLIYIWALRLTYNWVRRWRGLGHEDWRYTDFRVNTGKWYWPVSFLAIHLVPTVLVFGGCLSVYAAVSVGTKAFGIIDYLAIIVTLVGVLIEIIADRQLHAFLTSRKDERKILSSGLWAYSRHPNYFGEVIFWWGLFLFGLAAAPSYWWTIVGPVLITALFIFISIPMIEKHMKKRKPDYAVKRQGVSAFIPWFPKA